MFILQPLTRRILYVATFEIIAIIASTALLMLLSGGNAESSLPIATAISIIALASNYTYNLMFEKWEENQKSDGRSFWLRICHACGFEFGLFIIIIPIYMAWYNIDFLYALNMQAAILIFFLAYTFIFTYVFDVIFCLPNRSAPADNH